MDSLAELERRLEETKRAMVEMLRYMATQPAATSFAYASLAWRASCLELKIANLRKPAI